MFENVLWNWVLTVRTDVSMGPRRGERRSPTRMVLIREPVEDAVYFPMTQQHRSSERNARVDQRGDDVSSTAPTAEAQQRGSPRNHGDSLAAPSASGSPHGGVTLPI